MYGAVHHREPGFTVPDLFSIVTESLELVSDVLLERRAAAESLSAVRSQEMWSAIRDMSVSISAADR